MCVIPMGASSKIIQLRVILSNKNLGQVSRISCSIAVYTNFVLIFNSLLLIFKNNMTMLKVQLIIMFVCAQIFLINSFALSHIQRPFLLEPESESNELISKILQNEILLNEANPGIITSVDALLDQTDGHPRNFQKRGRQCLWKVCSWALDKRSLRSSVPSSSSNSVDELSKLLY
ncbi:unnamed protein product [Rotaria sordida]|uniref:Uncharacterized protein n=1 Tax=Rotaria sordida TaxID=392033 RepID=A0A819IS43_9BILA|nr:unnamed protein product [Rotaria sordida]